MLLRMMSKWVWVSFAIALVGGVSMAACGDEPSPTPIHYPPVDAVNSNPNCGPRTGHIFFEEMGDVVPDLLRWTQDGTHIILDQPRGDPLSGGGDPTDGSNIYLVDAGGTRLRMIVDANPGYVSLHGTYADVSPDGTQVVYVSCEYPTGPEVDTTTAGYRYHGARYHYVWDRERYNYEIVVRKIDGTDPRRLTENIVMDRYPVWSPDGSRIAFARTARDRGWGIPDGVPVGIVVAAADGSDQRTITDQWASSIAWSPDGQRLAFLQVDGAAYIVGADGSNLMRLGGRGVTESPAWSPDGSLVAFGRSGEDISDIVISSPDGSDQRAIVGLRGISLWTSDGSDVRFSAIPESTDSGEQRVAADLVAASIAWSPDGSEVRFVGSLASMESDDGAPAYAGIFSVGVDGTDMRIIAEIEWPSLVSWSPDGSRVAVRRIPWPYYSSGSDRILTPEVVLYTMSSDGSDKQVMVRGTPTHLVAERSDRGDVSRDVAACSGGYVVPDPQDNPGLVRDCETLLGLREALAGDAVLNWSAEVSIEGWQGVLVKGSPLRVRWLNIHRVDADEGLTGVLPPELGNLTALERLWFRSQYRLGGEIPPELGKLSNLKDLVLEADLGGEIPSELGNLTSLEGLILGTGLEGEIPSELGNLHNLIALGLSNNDLTGNIPLELGDIGKGLSISVYGNSGLTGRVPSKVWYSVNSIDIQRTSLMPPRGIVCTEEVFIGQQCRTK